ncbi:MAG: DUF1080 domain-containing protein [Bacteroidetes bacterium]|nr:DUF1080 domain-containing protein [Bacteroidota bacterium]
MIRLFILSLATVFVTLSSVAQERPKPEETEVWEPVPPVVTPGDYAGPQAPPSDAIILFDGTNLDEWVSTRTGKEAGWAVGNGVVSVGQGYELQILDSYQNDTYVNGMAGATYKQSIPLVNPLRPPGQWQVYDVVWRAPRFDEAGNLTTPARVTAFMNGILIQDNVEMEGETYYIGQPEYHPFDEAPIHLQAHGDPGPTLSFRNIWIRPLAQD